VLGILKRIVAGAHPPLGEARPDLPPRLVQTIEAMLRVDVATRLCDPSLVSDRLVAVVRDAGFADPRRALRQTLGPAIEEHTRIWAARASHTQVTNVITAVAHTAERSATVIRKMPRGDKRSSVGFVAVGIGVAVLAAAMGWYVMSAKVEAVAVDVAVTPQPVAVPVTPQPVLPAPNSPPKSMPLPAVETPVPLVTHPKTNKPSKPQPAPEPGAGTLKLIALPWAEIYLDDEKVGTTPGFRGRELSTGRHHLKIVNPNFSTIERDFEIHTNQDTKLSVDLEKL